VQDIQSLYPDHVSLAGKWWEHDVRRIGLHDLPNLVQPSQEDGVDFGRRDLYVLNENSNSHGGIVEPLLGQFDGLRRVARNEDVIRLSAVGTRR
jgi:hypothetical protein